MLKRNSHNKPLLVNTWADEDKKADNIFIYKKIAVWIGMFLAGLLFWWFVISLLTGCSFADEVKASYYSNASLKKEGTWKNGETLMANGHRFDEKAMTCACRLYPLGTMVKVTNKETGKFVIVKVTDRIGKRFANTRIDLSKGAFARLASLKQGLINVTVTKES
jgi:rare lipoprotein A